MKNLPRHFVWFKLITYGNDQNTTRMNPSITPPNEKGQSKVLCVVRLGVLLPLLHLE